LAISPRWLWLTMPNLRGAILPHCRHVFSLHPIDPGHIHAGHAAHPHICHSAHGPWVHLWNLGRHTHLWSERAARMAAAILRLREDRVSGVLLWLNDLF
jgi:hypothetical protein